MNDLQSTSVIQNPHDRVRNHSPKSFTKAIDKKTDFIIQATIEKGQFAIFERLNKLDLEWDIDRALLLFFSGVVMAQTGTAIKKNKKNWLWGPLVQSSFLLMHATFGWCPPVPILRKLGFRTRFEIQAEREELLNALQLQDQKNVSITEWDFYESI